MVLLVYLIIRITAIYTFKAGRSNRVLITILQFVHAKHPVNPITKT